MKIFAAIAFMAVLSGTFSNVIIETAFYLQKNYIVREKCENRNNPEKHCNGKCYLKKQLQQEEQRNRQANNYEKFELNWFNQHFETSAIQPSYISSINLSARYQFLLTPGHVRPVDHPPA